MALQDPNQAIQVPGRFCIGPTQNGLLAAYPHGGTALGFISAAEFIYEEDSVEVPDFARNLACINVIGDLAGWRVRFALEQWDSDFWSLFSATVTGHDGVSVVMKNTRPGGLLTPTSPILFSPYDRLAHPGVLIYAPTPEHTRPVSYKFRKLERLAPGYELRCALDGNGNTIEVGPLSGLSLT